MPVDESAEPRSQQDPPRPMSPEHLVEESEMVVLPWWQNPVNILTMLVTTALVAGMIGWLIADLRADEPNNEVDVGFLQDMRDHHEQAVVMSTMFLDLDDTHPGLRAMARTIAFGQSIEIGRMVQLLRMFGEAEVNEGDTSMSWMGMSGAAGSMPGMASPAQLDALAAASGAEADETFVQLMTAHHLGGIDMARYAAANGANSEVRSMATAMADAQQAEIIEMRGVWERAGRG